PIQEVTKLMFQQAVLQTDGQSKFSIKYFILMAYNRSVTNPLEPKSILPLIRPRSSSILEETFDSDRRQNYMRG
ncbi:MAG: hypothetical protein WB511_07795, partial [Nitrososphaeraceae archaeon]